MPSSADVERIKRIVARIKKYDRDVQVTYVSGWQNRGASFGRVPVGMIDHHDASASSSGTWGALGVVTSGRAGLPGPLSQFFVARGSVPRIAVVAAGRANHAGAGGPKIGVPRDSGNAYLYGTEKANNGTGERYSDASIHATKVLFAAVMDVIGQDASHVIGHKEWAPARKIDPTYDMGWMRGLVKQVMRGEVGEDMELTDKVKLSDWACKKMGLKPGSKLSVAGVLAYAAAGGFRNAEDVDRIKDLVSSPIGSTEKTPRQHWAIASGLHANVLALQEDQRKLKADLDSVKETLNESAEMVRFLVEAVKAQQAKEASK